MAAPKDLLRDIYLFKDMSADDLDVVTSLIEVQICSEGQELFLQGEEARALFVIKQGSVRIYQKGTAGEKIEVAVLGSGSHFGEMALVDGERRSATAEVLEKAEILQLDYDKLSTLLRKNSGIAVHFYRALAKFLCGRLRVTTTDLSFAREANLRHF